MLVLDVPVSTIRPYWRNPRDNSNAICAVKRSIEEYGFNQPLVLDVEHTIIAGHTRYKAAVELGLEMVPCVIIDISPEKAKQYRIADNKIHELSEWNMDALVQELREIAGEFDMSVFMPNDDLDRLCAPDISYRDVSELDIAKQGAINATHHQSMSNRHKDDECALACPHCLSEFTIAFSAIKDAFEAGRANRDRD